MTDRVNALVVILEKDVRDDDLEATRNAIQQIKGVLSVEYNVTDISDSVARMRVKSEVQQKLIEFAQSLNTV